MRSNSQTKRFLSFVLTLAMCLGMLGGVTFGAPAVAYAADPVTVTTADALKAALESTTIDAINVNANITIPAGTYGSFSLHKTITLYRSRSLTIAAGTDVTLKNMTITGRDGSQSYRRSDTKIINNGTLVLDEVMVTGRGRGINNTSILILDKCSFYGMRSGVEGSAIYNTGTVYANNTTFIDNNGTYWLSSSSNGTVYMTNCTSYNNVTDNGVTGLYLNGGSFYAVNSLFMNSSNGVGSQQTYEFREQGNPTVSLINCVSISGAHGSTAASLLDVFDSIPVEHVDYGYYAPISGVGAAVTGGSVTYCDFSSPASIKMGYWDGTAIAALGDLGTPATIDYVNEYFETNGRAANIIGASDIKNYEVEWFLDETDTKPAYDETTDHGVIPNYYLAEKEPDEYYTYTFEGWLDDGVTLYTIGTSMPAIKKNTRFIATYSAIDREYTVTWKNYDGTVLTTTAALYQAVPAYPGADPVKPADDYYASYQLSGWNDGTTTYAINTSLPAVTGNTTYTAVFTGNVPQEYAVTLVTNGGVINSGNVTSYSYGTKTTLPTDISYPGHSFGGWYDNPDFEETPYTVIPDDVTGDAIFYAKWNDQTFTIRFMSESGTELQKSEYAFNAIPEYTGPAQTKASTPQYEYTFAGWQNADKTTLYAIGTSLPAVTAGTRYYAAFDETVRSHEITWTMDDGVSVLATQSALYGTDDIVYPLAETPTKAATVACTYQFAGWLDAASGTTYAGLNTTLAAVTGPVTYQAIFDEIPVEYDISWLKEDGSLIDVTKVEYGKQPTHAAETKQGDAQYRYDFAGWQDAATGTTYAAANIPTVAGIATYKAIFDQKINEYLITWANDDDSVVATQSAFYGTMPTNGGIIPTKVSDKQYDYTFKEWTPEITTVAGVATYKAVYDKETRSYLITWENYNGDVLATQSALYGTTPENGGIVPTKPSDAAFIYNFEGWDPEVTTVSGVATYTATYSAVGRPYTVTWKYDNINVITTSSVIYGESPVFPGGEPTKPSDPNHDHEFYGWIHGTTFIPKDTTIPAIYGDEEYIALFTDVAHQYLVTFADDDDSVIATCSALYNNVPPQIPADPTKAPTDAVTYTFKGWQLGDTIYKTTFPAITADTTFTAVYDTHDIYYTVTWNNDLNTPITTTAVKYGEHPVFPDLEGPTKEATAEYAYVFEGWLDKNDQLTTPAGVLPAVTTDASFTATFSAILKTYTIKWFDGDGNEIKTNLGVPYHTAPVYDGDTPVKTTDAAATYTFLGWKIGNNEYPIGTSIPGIEGNTDIYAYYQANARSYEISWYNENGQFLDKKDWEYGDTPTHAALTKDPDEGATYTFAGWDPAVTTVAGIASYTAVFDQHPYHYDVTWMYKGGTIIDNNVTHGSVVCWTGADPSQGSFLFTGWLKDDKDFYAKGEALPPVTANVTYKAQYIDTSEEYTVIWKNYDNTILTQSAVVWGTNPVYQGEEPTKPSDAEYNYKFNGWLHEGTTPYAIGATLPAVTTDTAFTAQFTTGEAIDQPLAFSVVSVSKTYGDATFQYLATGANDGGYRTYYSSDPYYASVDETSGIVTIHNAGTVTITAIAAATTKYKQATASYTLTVNKATLTLTAANKEAKTGEAVPALTYTVSGLKNGDTESGVTLSKPTLACNANMSTAGTYTITITGGSFSNNYEPAYVNGTLTVTQSSSGGGGGGGGGSSGGGGGSSGGGGGGGSSSGGSSSTTTTTTTTTNTNQTISITVPEATTGQSSASFRDVEPNRWSANAITYVVSRGIFNGNGDGTFEPEVPMTRAMTAQVLYNLAGRPAVANDLTFSDRDNLLWFTDAVAWASSMGLITGEPDGTFRGNDNVTREQFVTILYRLAEKAGLDVTKRATLNAFRDSATVRDFSRNAMEWAVAVNLINGDEGRLNPNNSADREQIATMVMRFAIMLDEANKAAASSTKK